MSLVAAYGIDFGGGYLPGVQGAEIFEKQVDGEGVVGARVVGAGMRAHDQVFSGPDAVVRGDGFGGENVQNGAAEMAGIEQVAERVLIEQRPAADIDDIGAFGERCQALAGQHVAGGWGAGGGDEQKFGIG